MSEQVKAIATAWMKHQGYTDAEIAAGEAEMDHSLCEKVPGVGWDCMDENGYHRHPEVGALAEAAEMANVALEALKAGQVEPRVVNTVEELEALPIGTAVRDRYGDVGVWQGDYLRFPETSVMSPAYSIKHWGPLTVLTTQPAISAEQVRTEAESRWPDNTNSLSLNAERAWRQRAFIEGARFAAGLTVAGESDG